MNINTTIGLEPAEDITTIIDENSITLSLEQELPDDTDINMRDVYDMWVLAKNGISARTKKNKGCPVRFTETTVSFDLEFIVWPFPVNTPYNLSTTIGDIGVGERFDRVREQSVTFPLARNVAFERSLTNMSYVWETPMYNDVGDVVPSSDIEIVRDSLVIDNPYFGVARVRLTEEGFKHIVTVVIVNVDDDGNNLQVDDVNITITASYTDENGEFQTKELKLELPECIKRALKLCKGKPNMVCQSCGAFEVRVYWNACTGDVVKVETIDFADGEGSWCLPTE